MLNQGRFTGAGMSDDTQKLALIYVKTHILHRVALEGRTDTVRMSQIFDF
jgi:hypothetical protein